MGTSALIVRPYGIVINGALELGLELLLFGGKVTEIRPHTGVPESYVVSPAFINAHSHLEYRGFQGNLRATDYWTFIREIKQRKVAQTSAQLRDACFLAAEENRYTGVAKIGEHSDRPYSGEALQAFSVGGVLFQELISFFESVSPEKLEQKHQLVDSNKAQNERFFNPVFLAPHATYTVFQKDLQSIPDDVPISIHVAETQSENDFFQSGTGPIADFYQKSGIPFEKTGLSAVATMEAWKVARPNAQFVHCCAASSEDISILANRGVSVAHCPRSNRALSCPDAPVREMLDSGIQVGLGLDSAASSGPINMFAEMQAALAVSLNRSRPIAPEEVWRMATSMSNASLPIPSELWDIFEGSQARLIKIHVDGATTVEDLINRGSPAVVEWVKHEV